MAVKPSIKPRSYQAFDPLFGMIASTRLRHNVIT